MSIHEQIIAFLDGELTDESTLAELMHVLAVSPEKRGFLVEQARLSRAMTTMAGSIAPSAAADAAILAGIAAIDSTMPPPPPARSPSVLPRQAAGRRLMIGAGAVVIALLGFAAGYLLRDNESTNPVDTNVIGRSTFPRLSIPRTIGIDLQRELAGAIHVTRVTEDAVAPLLQETARLRLLKEKVRQVIVRQPVHVERQRAIGISSAVVDTAGSRSIDGEDGPRLLWKTTPIAPSTPARPPVPETEPDVQSISPAGGTTATIEGKDGTLRRWNLGMRNIVRTSLPRIYGLPSQQKLLTDREVTLGLQMEEGWFGLKTPVSFGAAVGNTQFSQSFRRQEGGSSVSSVVEQTPNLWYGRGWITPQIVSINGFSGGLELGAGGTLVGPFATIGLGGEYRPIESISVGLGMSTWLLWSQLETQNVLSANLNGYLGASFWF